MERHVSGDAPNWAHFLFVEERELIVRGYVSSKRQMAVCCCLHTKGDGIKAGFAMGAVGAASMGGGKAK